MNTTHATIDAVTLGLLGGRAWLHLGAMRERRDAAALAVIEAQVRGATSMEPIELGATPPDLGHELHAAELELELAEQQCERIRAANDELSRRWRASEAGVSA